uniref:cytochrome c oxidase subunit II n=1 Tax=Falcolipeurus marginalis TaxID=236517 RepID=UPI00211E3E91|nr:cytochrome c oxidase subunit II [Falcolipeurus marginalis]UTT72600.1 cytochrome c oxidase subunit 2 [Falcolipeurus marginalis]
MMYGIFFQDSWSPIMTHISGFHDHVMIVVVMVLSIVFYLFMMVFIFPCCYRFFFGLEVLELIWTILPGMVLGAMAIPSLHVLYLADEVLNPLISVKSMGNQWFWSYEFSDFPGIEFDSYMIPESDLSLGDFRLLEVDNNLILPFNTEIRLFLSSSDVIHSWTVPSLGVKMDAIPGRLNQLCILSTHCGYLYGQCSEICGSFHSFMPICVEFVTDDSFMNWVMNFSN